MRRGGAAEEDGNAEDARCDDRESTHQRLMTNPRSWLLCAHAETLIRHIMSAASMKYLSQIFFIISSLLVVMVLLLLVSDFARRKVSIDLLQKCQKPAREQGRRPFNQRPCSRAGLRTRAVTTTFARGLIMRDFRPE